MARTKHLPSDCFRHEDRSLQKNQLGTSKKHQLDHQFSSLLCGSSLKVWSWAGLDAGILSIESSQRSQPRLKSCGRRSKFKSGQRSNPPLPLSPWHKAMVLEPSERCTRHPLSKGFCGFCLRFRDIVQQTPSLIQAAKEYGFVQNLQIIPNWHSKYLKIMTKFGFGGNPFWTTHAFTIFTDKSWKDQNLIRWYVVELPGWQPQN